MLECLSDIDCLVEFQTAIVGVIGFVGIIAAQFINAWLARAQAERDRTARRKALKASILAELRLFKEIYDRNARDSRPREGGQTMFPKMRRQATANVMDGLGVLEPKQVNPALRGLLAVDEANRRLSLIAPSNTDEYFRVDAENWTRAAGIFRSQASEIEQAIIALEESPR